jgi:hypothetical protein
MLGNLVISLLADTKKFDKGLKEATGKAEQFKKKMTNIGNSLSKVGRKMTLFVTGPLVALGTAAVKVAADAEEMRDMFNIVFGDMAKQTEDWAKTFGSSIGRSSLSMMEFAASLQDTFVPMGFARDQAAKLSTTMVELAVDVGSFKNVATKDVIRDFQSALVGNHETVRKYGIVITQATLEQELFNMGMEGGIQQASEQQKMLARMNIIMQGTADAHGNAALTAGSFSNQLRSLKEQFKDVFAAIGAIILPILTKLIAKIKIATQVFLSLDDKTKKLIITILAIAAAIGPVLMIVGKLASGIAMLSNPIGMVILAIGALVTAGILLYKNWDKVKTFMTEIWNIMSNVAKGIFTQMKVDILNSVKAVLTAIYKIRSVFPGEAEKLKNAINKLNEALVRNKEKVEDSDEAIVEAVGNIKSMKKEEKELTEIQKMINGLTHEGAGAVGEFNLSLEDLIGNVEGSTEQLEAFSETASYMINTLMDEVTANTVLMALYEQTIEKLNDEFVTNVTVLSTSFDEMAKYRAGLNQYDTQSKKSTREALTFREALEKVQEQEKYLAEFTAGQFITSFADAWEGIFTFTKSIKDAVKDMIASVLRGLGKKYAALAVAFFWRPRKALQYAVASAALFAASAGVRALQQGGLIDAMSDKMNEYIGGLQLGGFGDRIPAMLEPGEMVMRKEVVAENQPALQAMNAGEGVPIVVNVNVGTKHLYSEITKGISNKQITVDARAVV